MELRPGSLTVFFLHVIPTKGNGMGNTFEVFLDIFWFNPYCWVIRMIVITVHYQAVCLDEVVDISLVVLKVSTSIIKLNGRQ